MAVRRKIVFGSQRDVGSSTVLAEGFLMARAAIHLSMRHDQHGGGVAFFARRACGATGQGYVAAPVVSGIRIACQGRVQFVHRRCRHSRRMSSAGQPILDNLGQRNIL